MKSSKKIKIITTGGTIAGKGEPGKTAEYKPGAADMKTIISGIANINELAEIDIIPICSINSDDITETIWLKTAKLINKLSENNEADGFIITHGTDTLEETAFFLNLTLKTSAPVVITGAMRPPTSLSPDGDINLYRSVILASSEKAKNIGVLTVSSEYIYSARAVRKNNNFRVEAFNGGDFGCTGYIRDDGIYIFNKPSMPHTIETEFDINYVENLPNVEIAYFSAGASEKIIQTLAEISDGVIIAGAGCGNMSQKWLQKISEFKSIPFIRSSRAENGIVLPDKTLDTSENIIPSYTLPPYKAKILLQIALTKTTNFNEIKRIFKTY